jgi:hypothetical protein
MRTERWLVKFTNKELHNLNYSLNISRIIKIREGEMGWGFMTSVREQKI